MNHTFAILASAAVMVATSLNDRQDPNIPDPGLQITGARVMNGRVRFTFGGSDTVRYNIVWSRPGKAEVTDMRWIPAGQKKTMQDYIINEPALPDTLYYFKVQAVGIWKYSLNGVSHSHDSEWVWHWFRTPPARLADRIQKTDKVTGQQDSTTKKPNPFEGKVDAQVQMLPRPILGKQLLLRGPGLTPKK